MKDYQHDHMHALEARKQWKQSEQIEDVHWEAEAAKSKAAAEKEHREVEEQSQKCHHLKEEEAEASTSAKHCKLCLAKGQSVLWQPASMLIWCRPCVCVH